MKQTSFEIKNKIQSDLDRYKQYGIKYYEFYADTDDRTCDKCAALDGKRFKLKQAKFGVNCPPMHDGCRCCILPVID
jgi:SPP1 gp7 family putative phage head morphogenesis protein